MFFKSWYRDLEDAGGSWLEFCIWSWFGYSNWSSVHWCSEFWLLSWFWRCKEHPCPLSPYVGLWRTLEVPDWGLASWSWFEYDHWSLIHPWSEFLLSILILKVQRTSMSFKSSFGPLEDTESSWMGPGILIFILIWSLDFNRRFFQVLAPYLEFEGAENIHVL